MQVLGRVFEAGGLIVAGDVAGYADIKDVAEPLVEDNLVTRESARVEDRAVRTLARRQRMLTRRRLMRMLILLGSVMGIAGLEFGEHRIGGRQRLLCAPAARRPTATNEVRIRLTASPLGKRTDIIPAGRAEAGRTYHCF